VINSIPAGGHNTRTLIFDNDGLLYVSIGSLNDVDTDSTRARIKVFDISTIPSGGINWSAGKIFADGLRNEVGLDFDAQNRLWGVESGIDSLNRTDIGGDISLNNPSEEVNLFADSGKFYGYPYCWSEYDLPPQYSKGRGSQWAHPNFINDGTHTDAWCAAKSNVVTPEFNMRAHTVPLDLKFYHGNSFPFFPSGGAFVAQHGSWSRQPAIGFRLVYLPFANGIPSAEVVVLRHDGTDEQWPNFVRPVGITIGNCGLLDCIYVSSDESGQIIQISLRG